MRIETIISADIGGTNTRFKLFEVRIKDPEIFRHPVSSVDEIPSSLVLKKKYHNQDFDTFLDCLKSFLNETGIKKPPVAACFAVAGPVKDNAVRCLTNRASWSIDGDLLSEQTGIKTVRIINDFLANGYGLLTLNEETECVTLQQAPKQKNSPIACIGAGTGLGECFLTPGSTGSTGSYVCFPTEGGHAEFCPRDEVEIRLLRFLKEKFAQSNRVSVERVVSGPGLANIYEFLSKEFPDLVDHDLHAQIEGAGEFKGAVISTHQHNELCQKTMEIFIRTYGAEAGVAGLKWLPYGGLYLTGGLTPKCIDLIKGEDSAFMTALLDKGRVSSMLYSIPIYAVMAEDLGERGAHYMALQLLQEIESKTLPHLASASPEAAPAPATQPARETTSVQHGAAEPADCKDCTKTCSGATHTIVWGTVFAAVGFMAAVALIKSKHLKL